MNTPKVYAPTVRRRTPTGSTKLVGYFDCTAYGSGYFRRQGWPGAVVLNKSGQMLDMVTGEVYFDERFKTDSESGHVLRTLISNISEVNP